MAEPSKSRMTEDTSAILMVDNLGSGASCVATEAASFAGQQRLVWTV